ncbi:MAG: flavodoxin domain-containing protein [Acetobacteraceae bacterium]|nr:flavodoxin domain-containing protein [Acetobacteraceae bacterium]
MWAWLLRVHRYLGLVLAPFFLVTILSGGILALEPILGVGEMQPQAGVDIAALTAALPRLDPAGTARMLVMLPDGATAIARYQGGNPPVRFAIASGEAAPNLQQADIFDLVRGLHENLWVGLGVVVQFEAWAMVFLILVGPLLAWPRLRNTTLGWHIAIGWMLLPLVLFPPATEAVRTLGLGSPGPAASAPPSVPPLALADALQRAAPAVDLTQLATVRGLRNGNVLLTTGKGWTERSWLVSRDASRPAEVPPNWPRLLHDGIWAAPWSGWVSLFAAWGLLGLLTTGSLSYWRRWQTARRRSGDAGADLLVAFASQTGTAARYAEATAAALRQGNARVATASLATLQPEDFKRYRHVLVVASTTGDGGMPDQGRAFLQAMPATKLTGVTFALLALGDRRYARFCGGGETLRTALIAAGADELTPMVRADGDPADAWKSWLADLAGPLRVQSGALVGPQGDAAVHLTLVARTRLDDPGQGDLHEVCSLVFAGEGPMEYRPGDLLLVSPGAGLPERCYSIGSAAVDDGRRLMLTVALNTWTSPDGQPQFGAASGLLCRTLPIGARFAARIRRHPGFHPPDDPDRPIIMVATGCGIAPFVGFLAERAARGSRGGAWLIFGNRHRAGDFYYADQLQAWQRAGVLQRLDTAFSRDPDDGTHVQDRLEQQSALVWDWLTRRNAVLYACGRLATLGPAIEITLMRIAMSQGGLSDAAAATLLARWGQEDRIKRDLFD